MKKTLLTIAAIASCAAIMASCGNNTAENTVNTTTTASTTAVTTINTTTQSTTVPTTVVTTAAATAAPTTAAQTKSEKKKENKTAAAKKTSAAKTTAKKAATTKKATPKTTAKQAGLTKADYEWAAQKANEYILTLPMTYLDKTADSYSFEGSVLFNKTREEILAYTKDEIDCEYNSIVNAEGSLSKIGMYVSVRKDADGYYLALRYVTWL